MYLGLVRERETRDQIIKRLENDPRYKYMLPPSKAQTQEEDKEIDDTFNNLQHMVEETAAMAHAAVNCSPSRAKSMLETLDRTQRRFVLITDPLSHDKNIDTLQRVSATLS